MGIARGTPAGFGGPSLATQCLGGYPRRIRDSEGRFRHNALLKPFGESLMTLRLLALVLACLGTSAAIAQDVSSDKGKLSYSVGYDFGRSLVIDKIDVDPAVLSRAIQDGMAHKDPALPQVLQAMHQRLLAVAKANFHKAAADNKTASDRFMAQNRVKPGVKTLADGIQYRVIEEGSGPAVKADGLVRIMYRISTSDGQEFRSSYGGPGSLSKPVFVAVKRSALAGIRQVLPMMRQGSHWEVVLPPEQAYGDDPRSPIGPSQAVVLDIKIVDAAYSGPPPPEPP
jgi:FKBP-type peptidyl-prolyl cis-trans isomerase